MYGLGGRPEYSLLANAGDKVWAHAIDPVLRFIIGNDDITGLMRIRVGIQLTLLAAAILIPVSFFWNTGHVLTASGLLFDIAGAARIFLLEEISYSVSGFTPNEYDNYPSVAMRELIMPEGINENKINDNPISFFYYKKRGVLFLFLGFVLQMVGDFF
jgi:hypothetical protein